MESCSTCATILSQETQEKAKESLEDRRVHCCSRIICGDCLQDNPRFATYCPYCQISVEPTPLPQGLKEPPSYTASSSSAHPTEQAPPPPYTQHNITTPVKPRSEPDDEKAALQDAENLIAEDTLHFLDHNHDSIASLSLRYGVPQDALRRTNNITSDHLLLARKTLLIPGEFYKGGVSLSPCPIDGEEEELRKNKIRRFMTSCKVPDYDVAHLYLEQASYDLGMAVETYMADDAWEKAHPQKGVSHKKKRWFR